MVLGKDVIDRQNVFNVKTFGYKNNFHVILCFEESCMLIISFVD